MSAAESFWRAESGGAGQCRWAEDGGRAQDRGCRQSSWDLVITNYRSYPLQCDRDSNISDTMDCTDGQVYIDNADDMDLEVPKLPQQWTLLRDYLEECLIINNATSHNWIFSETDVIILRECLEVPGAEAKLVQQTQTKDEGVLECSWCDDIFLTSAQLSRHWLVSHLAWDAQCWVCEQPLQHSIQRHECGAGAGHQCRLCNKTFASKLKLTRHYFNHHSKFYCCLSEKVFDQLEDFRQNIQAQNEELERSCILCKVSLKFNNLGLKEHLLQSHFGPIIINKPTVFEDKDGHHSDIELITQISMKYKPNKTETYQFDNYSCPHCLRKFSAKSGLKIHVGIAHKGEKIVFCSRCPASFSDVDSCKLHFREEHSRKKSKRNMTFTAEREQPKSLVPTNMPMPMEGTFTYNDDTLNNNGDQRRTNEFNDTKPKEPEKKKPRRPIPDLVKIQDLKTPEAAEKLVSPSLGPGVSEGQEPRIPPIRVRKSPTGHPVILAPKTSPQLSSSLLPSPATIRVTSPSAVIQVTRLASQMTPSTQQIIGSKPVKAILPNTLAPKTLVTPDNTKVVLKNTTQQQQAQVFVPAMTSSGTTILLKLEEAQKHLNNGVVTFLPSTSAQPVLSVPPSSSEENSHDNNIEDDMSSDIMREKVALNLPVVMTKRTNKKLAQDNPFFRIRSTNASGLEGDCRSCEAVFSFRNTEAMVTHYKAFHNQDIQINSFPLYHELIHKTSKNGSKATMKYFLCFFCGKEFTTK